MDESLTSNQVALFCRVESVLYIPIALYVRTFTCMREIYYINPRIKSNPSISSEIRNLHSPKEVEKGQIISQFLVT